MKFFEYHSEYHALRSQNVINNKISIDDFYQHSLQTLVPTDFDPFSSIKLFTEYNWIKDKKPYYNVYPSIIPHLLKISLDNLFVNQINLPLPYLLVRFPENNILNFEHDNQKYYLKTILIADNTNYYRNNIPHMVFWIDFGEYDYELNCRVQTYKSIKKSEGFTINQGFKALKSHESFERGVICPEDFLENCAKLVCTICLMAEDQEIIQPDVLSCDEDKFEKTKDLKYIEKAKRRGKYGWSVGKNIQISPHVRASCPAALYWTGPKKSIPKIRFRKGCIVHKKTISNIQTGFLG